MTSHRFEGVVETGGAFAVVVTVPDSPAVFGTRRPVEVSAQVDGHAFEATLMPSGAGTHWLPLRAAVCTATGRGTAGDRVDVLLETR